MTILTPTRRSPSSRDVSDLYRQTLGWVVAAWLVATAIAMSVVMIRDEDRSGDVFFVALMSGVIALMSMLPGLCLRRAKAIRSQLASGSAENQAGSGVSADPFGDFVLASGMGMIFRLFGTVALFLFCRYQLAESSQWVAGFTIGWYAYLTSVEVGVLAFKQNRVSTESGKTTSGTDANLSANVLPAKAKGNSSQSIDSSVSSCSSLVRLHNSNALPSRPLGVLEA
ncbi:membrane protein [Rhodopirellula maiorica SM1]|uniref:Membrane protein n=1 Tax=Rhodopirellula maiorica SM1 TaxID=1265738 RepID=M5S0I3_9BACT|nr:hypothetical protein [Rhodopirellula maiorica]EMI21162.1 membrane protein [Rhodopirellula maiorica SM1]